MKKKTCMLILWLALIVFCGVVIWLCGQGGMGIASAIAGGGMAFCIEKLCLAIQDFCDTTDWKTSQTKLLRGGFITDNTIVRISFAYLFRIKSGNKYLLVLNSRNTGKFQPIGGVYKYKDAEKDEFLKRFNILDDYGIPIDESSRNDYRLRMQSQYLRQFVKRFDDKNAKREKIDDVGREFREELIETGILNWNQIEYRYCGRYLKEVKYNEHFQIYELQLSDIVELIPTPEQESDLRELTTVISNEFCFATIDQINHLGVDIEAGKLYEWIGDHTKRMLQENESGLLQTKDVGKIFKVNIEKKLSGPGRNRKTSRMPSKIFSGEQSKK